MSSYEQFCQQYKGLQQQQQQNKKSSVVTFEMDNNNNGKKQKQRRHKTSIGNIVSQNIKIFDDRESA